MPLPSDRVVLEILEDVVVDERLTALVARLTTSRYKVALDDFTYGPLLAPLIDLAEIVKIDLLAHSPDELQRQVEPLGRHDVTLLAEKVETYEEFDAARSSGSTSSRGSSSAVRRP